jgi:hypothetical protein
MAAETGGRVVPQRHPPAKIASQILSDFSCVYLLSFDPAGFKQDAPLMLSVKSLKPKVKT